MSRIVTNGTIVHGSKGSIGATALQLTAVSTILRRGVTIKASSVNSTNKIYVGLSTVTAGVSAPTTDGFELGASETLSIEIDDPSKLYVIGSTTGLSVSWIAT